LKLNVKFTPEKKFVSFLQVYFKSLFNLSNDLL
jgi:hypothetical protein